MINRLNLLPDLRKRRKVKDLCKLHHQISRFYQLLQMLRKNKKKKALMKRKLTKGIRKCFQKRSCSKLESIERRLEFHHPN